MAGFRKIEDKFYTFMCVSVNRDISKQRFNDIPI